jgi:hypothetical protein
MFFELAERFFVKNSNRFDSSRKFNPHKSLLIRNPSDLGPESYPSSLFLRIIYSGILDVLVHSRSLLTGSGIQMEDNLMRLAWEDF